MKKNSLISEKTRNSIKTLLANTKKKEDYRRVQCIWLRIELNMDAATVAQIVNLRPGTVRKVWSEFFRYGEKTLISKPRGGRRNFNLSSEEEKVFLSPFLKKSEQSVNITVTEIHDAYENLIGKKVPKSTIYRLLSRHGWKKKSGIKPQETPVNEKQSMRDYWIEGCAQALHPDRTGNISQQWLNTTLASMTNQQST